MPTRRAPYNATVVMGTKAGGVGPFTPVLTVSGRLVPVSSVRPLSPITRNAIWWLTIPTTTVSAGTAVIGGVQIFTLNFQTAHRFTVSTFPGFVFVAVGVYACLTRGGIAYTRVQVMVDPPAL